MGSRAHSSVTTPNTKTFCLSGLSGKQSRRDCHYSGDTYLSFLLSRLVLSLLLFLLAPTWTMLCGCLLLPLLWAGFRAAWLGLGLWRTGPQGLLLPWLRLGFHDMWFLCRWSKGFLCPLFRFWRIKWNSGNSCQQRQPNTARGVVKSEFDGKSF